MTIESEEFYNLMQTYRHAPLATQFHVCEAYQAVIAHVDSELSALRLKLEAAEKALGAAKADLSAMKHFTASPNIRGVLDLVVSGIDEALRTLHKDGK